MIARPTAAVGAATTFVAMVATPLARRGGGVRRATAAGVVGGLATTTFAQLRARHGGARAGAATVGVTTVGWLTEWVGIRTGRPFGRYRYTGRLRPSLGGVPVIVPVAWFAMAAPAREAVHAALGSRSDRRRRVVGGAAALVAWDLFLDPQMVAEGYWRWERAGRYRGIPLSNFVGWFLTAAVAMVVLEAAAPPADEPDGGLVAEYAGMAVMETLGFAAFFRDRTVAVVGGAAMLPIAATAAIAALRGGRLSRCG
ncbi:MAG: carotenoid biosynthesis protein [Acidimicrobiia bacterium]